MYILFSNDNLAVRRHHAMTTLSLLLYDESQENYTSYIRNGVFISSFMDVSSVFNKNSARGLCVVALRKSIKVAISTTFEAFFNPSIAANACDDFFEKLDLISVIFSCK